MNLKNMTEGQAFKHEKADDSNANVSQYAKHRHKQDASFCWGSSRSTILKIFFSDQEKYCLLE